MRGVWSAQATLAPFPWEAKRFAELPSNGNAQIQRTVTRLTHSAMLYSLLTEKEEQRNLVTARSEFP